jgi:5-formyltetrahydrofolate cyclo-ligase
MRRPCSLARTRVGGLNAGMSAKPALRKIIREKIARLTPHETAEKSFRICKAISQMSEWKTARVVCLFAPLPGEPDVELLKIGSRRVCYPRVNGVELDLYYVTDPQSMERTRWGIREPQADARHAADPGDIDLILVPGIAFSREGGRLGRGAGFYDRLLAREGWRARKIGVGFDCQLVTELPVEAHDHELDDVVTESGTDGF